MAARCRGQRHAGRRLGAAVARVHHQWPRLRRRAGDDGCLQHGAPRHRRCAGLDGALPAGAGGPDRPLPERRAGGDALGLPAGADHAGATGRPGPACGQSGGPLSAVSHAGGHAVPQPVRSLGAVLCHPAAHRRAWPGCRALPKGLAGGAGPPCRAAQRLPGRCVPAAAMGGQAAPAGHHRA